MAEFTTTPFEPWHLKLIKEGVHYARPDLDPETRAKIYRQIEGVTVLLDGEICAILGVVVLWPGVGEVTMIPTNLYYRNLKTCVKFTRQLISVAMETYGLHRLQATCLASHPKHARFLEFLGLQYEGKLHGYGPKGEDFMMYATVPVRVDQ
ncbi:MAG TPA: hypothetical protein VN081_03915 [Dongiaceae bacterium]|nr:hypothetical protein [Dongiaceae bacterium]